MQDSNVPTQRRQAAMYARQIKLGNQPHLIPSVLPTKALQCLDKDGQWKDRDMLMCSHNGVIYYFQEMRASNYGVVLYHVWAIFVNPE